MHFNARHLLSNRLRIIITQSFSQQSQEEDSSPPVWSWPRKKLKCKCKFNCTAVSHSFIHLFKRVSVLCHSTPLGLCSKALLVFSEDSQRSGFGGGGAGGIGRADQSFRGTHAKEECQWCRTESVNIIVPVQVFFVFVAGLHVVVDNRLAGWRWPRKAHRPRGMGRGEVMEGAIVGHYSAPDLFSYQPHVSLFPYPWVAWPVMVQWLSRPFGLWHWMAFANSRHSSCPQLARCILIVSLWPQSDLISFTTENCSTTQLNSPKEVDNSWQRRRSRSRRCCLFLRHVLSEPSRESFQRNHLPP